MNRNKRNIRIIAAIVAALIIVVAINTIDKKNAETGTLRIGDVTTLTGSAAFIGQSSMKGAEIGKLKAESEHPGLSIELFHEDSLFTPKGGIDAYTKLRDTQHIDALITTASNVSVAVRPVAANDNILHVAASSLATNFSSPDDLSFRLTATADNEAAPAIAYLQSKGLKKLGILYMNNEIGVSLKDSLKKTAAATDVKIVAEEGFAVDIKDFRSQIIKLKAAGADSVYIAGIAPLIAVALTQAKELSFNVPFVSYRAAEDPILITNAGKFAEGIIYTSAYDINNDSAENKEFREQYVKKYGEQPNNYAAETYEAVRLIADARTQCGADMDCTKKFMSSVKNRESLFGLLSFDASGDVKYSFFLKTVKDGKFVKVN